MIEINQESTNEEIDAYWKDVMQYRMPLRDEVSRLKNVGLGFYFSHKNFEIEQNRIEEHDDFLAFIEDDKRPFGNKNIPQSIMFNLGWDCKRVLVFSCYVPDWVEKEAVSVYEALIEDIKKDKVIIEKRIVLKNSRAHYA